MATEAVIGAADIAREQARMVTADPGALGAYETGLLDVPAEVEQHLTALLRRSRGDFHSADDVTLLRADDEPH